jgi:hypothetical protein
MAFSFSPEYGNSSTVTPSAFVGGAAFASVLALPVVGTVLFVSHRGVFSGLFNASALVSMTRMASLSGSSTALAFTTDFQAPLQQWSRRFFFVPAACCRSRSGRFVAREVMVRKLFVSLLERKA